MPNWERRTPPTKTVAGLFAIETKCLYPIQQNRCGFWPDRLTVFLFSSWDKYFALFPWLL